MANRPMPIKMQVLREERGLTKASLSRMTGMQAGVIGWIESRRFVPYQSQLEKIANALCYEGDPQELLEEE